MGFEECYFFILRIDVSKYDKGFFKYFFFLVYDIYLNFFDLFCI